MKLIINCINSQNNKQNPIRHNSKLFHLSPMTKLYVMTCMLCNLSYP